MQAAILRARLRLSAGLDGAAPRDRRALSRAALTATAPRESRRMVPREFDAGHVYHLFPVLTDERDASRRT